MCEILLATLGNLMQDLFFALVFNALDVPVAASWRVGNHAFQDAFCWSGGCCGHRHFGGRRDPLLKAEGDDLDSSE